MTMFQKATKRAVRARVALDGPSGAGKTWTALTWASVLGKKIAVVDTERGSASLYSDTFNFDVAEFSPPFHPERLIEAIKAAEKAGYDVLSIDSMSHFWEGEGGVLDLVDAAAARSHGNSWAGWKSGTPVLRHLIDTILATDMHIIATMRSKTEWVLEEKTNSQGKKVTDPKRVGMAPVMRAGTEYEFTLVGDLDLEHRLTISKSRCAALADLVIQPGRAAEAAETFKAWMNSGEEIASRSEIDALKSRMNKVEPGDQRRACKQGFADNFGNPDYLVKSKLPDALAYVAEWEKPVEPPLPEPVVTPPEQAVVAISDARERLAEAKTQHPAGKREYTTAQRLHMEARKAAISEEDFDLLVLQVTGGATSKANDLDDTQLNDVRLWLKDFTDGRANLDEIRAKAAQLQGEAR